MKGSNTPKLFLLVANILFAVFLIINTEKNLFHLVDEGYTQSIESSLASVLQHDTSIIVLSALIPTHPSIRIINDTVNSMAEMIDGLPVNTPMFISVDGLPADKNTPENIHRLHEYVKTLRLRFCNDSHVTILNNYEHGHISNSIRVALEVVKTEFIYVIQHDLKFVKHINHVGLVDSMREYPERLQIVRFGLRANLPELRNDCMDVRFFESEANAFKFALGKWSDNNHFTTKAYYERLLANIGSSGRPPEAPMMYAGNTMNITNEEEKMCPYLFQYLYNWKDGPFIEHLDGRLTLS